MSVEEDVVAHLIAEVAELNSINCRRGPVEKATGSHRSASVTNAVPQECVFVLDTAGLPAIAFSGSVEAIEPEFVGYLEGETYPSVQIWVRSGTMDYDGGKATGVAILKAIDMRPPTGYFEATASTSTPTWVRKDETDHNEWSINVDLKQQRC